MDSANTPGAQNRVGRRLELYISGRHSGSGGRRNSELGLLPRRRTWRRIAATGVCVAHRVDAQHFGQPLRLGVAGYYSRQDYGFGQNVDGWAGMTDVELPLNRQFSLSGEFFRGRALGGLYGGVGQSVVFSSTPGSAGTEIQALDSIGGWAQLKYRPAKKWEFNAAFGMDNPYASDLKYFAYPQSYGGAVVARNQAGFINMIYRPRSDLLFSAEYRHLTTYSLVDGGNSAGHLNLMMGVLF
jgi:hypothetical protein